MTASTTTAPLRCISSMATRLLLAELADAYAGTPGGSRVEVVSLGGVDAARRVAAGEPFDVVVLAADALAQLQVDGHATAGSERVVALSHVAIAVPGAGLLPPPAVDTESGLMAVLSAAPSIGYSTGPSGRALQALLERWGLWAQLQPRLVQAPPGLPVARMLAEGRVALGFQQRSELLREPGIIVLGNMPPDLEIVTAFQAALCTASPAPERAAAFIAWLCAPQTAEAKLRHGLEPAAGKP